MKAPLARAGLAERSPGRTKRRQLIALERSGLGRMACREMDDGVRRRTRPVTKRSRPSAYTSWHLAALRPGVLSRGSSGSALALEGFQNLSHASAGSRRDVLHRPARPAPSGARPRARVQMGHPSAARFARVAQLRLNSGQYADASPPRFHIIERASAARAIHGDPSDEVSFFDRHPVAGCIELFSAAPFKTTNLF